MAWRDALPSIFLATILTLANAIKPPHIDDTAYIAYARHIASAPLDPYGFAVFWWQHPQDANTLLAPPVFPYSLALAIRLGGDNPFVWKLLLFPWSLLLVTQVRGLLRRFARSVELPFLVILILSPAVLPSMNLMLDLPALALSLAALNLYFAATERRSLVLAVLAGLVAGLAMQTKYTAFVVPAAMFLWSATAQRWRCWPVAVGTAVLLFAGWEWFIAAKYGRSHFMLGLEGGRSWTTKVIQLPFLFSHLGGMVPCGIGIGLAALGVARRRVWCVVALMLSSYLALIAFDVTFTSPVHHDPPVRFQLIEVLFNLIACVGVGVLGLVVWTLRGIERGQRRRETLFLLLWLGLEVAGFLSLSPFPAARRVLGVGLVAALLVARLAARRALWLWRRGPMRGLVIGSVVLGVFYASRDLAEARVQEQGVDVAASWIAEHGGGRVWYVGHWGFQYHAERHGMQPVVPGYDHPLDPDRAIRLPPATVFRPGDWIVVPDRDNVIQQSVVLDPSNVTEPLFEAKLGGRVPVRTVRCFYDGRTSIEHAEGPWLIVHIYRVKRGFPARSG